MSAGNSGAVASAVVIGGGVAGLTAATGLAARGVEVTVLEARERVGGRTRGIEVAPREWVDAGAAYLGDRHTELLALLKELDLAMTPTTMAGASRFALARTDAGTDAGTDSGPGARSDAPPDADPDAHPGAHPSGRGDACVTRDGRFPPLNAVALGDLFDRLAELTAAVEPEAPWLTPEAARLDTLTAAEWAGQELSHPDARLFFPLFLGEMMAADPADVSVLHMAFYLRSGGGLRYLNAFEGGAQQDRVAGGAHLLCERLAARLTASPYGRLRLGEPALAVHQDPDGVTVRTARGEYRGDVAVVALPPLLADALDQRPAPPSPRAGERTGRGCAVKLHLVYPAPIWREHGLSGWSVNAEGPLLSTVDDSPSGGGAGVLTGFVTGAEAHRFAALDPSQQRAAAVAQAARLFPMLPEPIGFHVTDWVNETYSKGCYAALFGPGDWLRLGPALTAPHGRVHWAGTETSTEFFGLLEGAVRSGRRVVAEILDRPAG
ncbi:FAD-dependent oxidoreductase [Kitasatospora sp. A2-31]|uniref:flavin monoamine oxidase family protein n=1 Tax=Kitasatospora sp. A2-31 TaxID=2916414 RepID=UPI001EEB9056|nr:FAD-dependent oxidoreductase [Kitasatospora sp. A2-31]MCG6498763.1 FAD-dependent oxidoreductase [Kitasatospora sp. A2-31]